MPTKSSGLKCPFDILPEGVTAQLISRAFCFSCNVKHFSEKNQP